MKILYLESFFGGSHKDFALGFKANSRHEVDLITLPARFWKWRMRGAALYFLEQIENINEYDAVFATDMMDLTDFIGLLKGKVPPILMYFHENQLSYPLSEGEKRDFHMGFTNIISASAADQVLFNSQFHLDEFMAAARQLIGKLPDYAPRKMLEAVRKKAIVAYPGCRFDPGPVEVEENKQDPSRIPSLTSPRNPPLVVWNHRWEHDKNPDAFFDALKVIKNEGIPFSLALLGENFSSIPEVFVQAKKEFGNQIKVFGYVESREEYISWLKKGRVIVSCASQENFGISVIEGIRFGCFPLLPDRLSYPELIPSELQSKVLYQTKKELIEKLKNILVNFYEYVPLQRKLSKAVERFAWRIRVKQYDNALKNLTNILDLRKINI